MTRKQTLTIAREILAALPDFEHQQELLSGLDDMIQEMPGARWSKAAIYDAIEQFRIDHNGRLPNLCDFDRYAQLPSRSTIKNRFQITSVQEWFDQRYPDREYIYRGRFNSRSAFEWLDDFKTQYLSMKGGAYVGEEEYNRRRKAGSPSTKTIGKLLKVDSYKEILRLSGLDTRASLSITVNRNEQMDESQLERLNQGIAEIFERVLME